MNVNQRIVVVVDQISNELEVVMQANTTSYVGFGWKPSSRQLFSVHFYLFIVSLCYNAGFNSEEAPTTTLVD